MLLHKFILDALLAIVSRSFVLGRLDKTVIDQAVVCPDRNKGTATGDRRDNSVDCPVRADEEKMPDKNAKTE